jgi:protein ImuB
VFSACSAPSAVFSLVAIAQEFSPRYERHRDDLVSVDISGLTRLLGPARTIGEEIRREAAARGVRAHVAVAGTRTAALLLAQARPGLTVIAPGEEASALAALAIGILEKIDDERGTQSFAAFAGFAFKKWGVKTLGDLASLPPADLASRLGRPALAWQAIARGEDIRPLVPMLEEERFESSLDLEWPITDLEPLSFVLTRLLEPLSTRLERRDRGAAVLHVLLRLVTREIHVRRLELPTPMRDVRALRTLALLDLEAHPAEAAIDRVTIVIDPTPGRVVQHTLYTRAQPTPEQLSTLLARLGALMGQDRFGAPAAVDTDRPGAFAMKPFATEHNDQRRTRGTRREISLEDSAVSARSALNVVSAVRRCRQPVPARVTVVDGRPVRVATDRRGFAGGAVTHGAGPWRTSGEWWLDGAGGVDRAGRAGGSSESGRSGGETSVSSTHQPDQPHLAHQTSPTHLAPWNRDEWDLSLSDGAVYRVYRDRDANSWFIDAIVD